MSRHKGSVGKSKRYTLWFQNHGDTLQHLGEFSSQQEIADHLGVHHQSVWALVNGKTQHGYKLSRYKISPIKKESN